MRNTERERANRQEIFEHLDQLLGPDAQQIVLRVANLIRTGDNQQGLEVLTMFDAMIGGIGLHKQQPTEKLPGVYRSISYVFMALAHPDAEDRSRHIVEFACQNIESVLKKMVRLGFFEQMRSDFIPLGTLLRKVKRQIPERLYEDLVWLNGNVYTFAKHENDFSDRDEPEPEHYFGLDEAIAVYIIARKLVVELEGFVTRKQVLLAE